MTGSPETHVSAGVNTAFVCLHVLISVISVDTVLSLRESLVKCMQPQRHLKSLGSCIPRHRVL